MSSSGYFQAVHDTIVEGVIELNFKNGAFLNSITKTTPAIEAMHILAVSPHLSTPEKETVNSCRNELIAIRNRFPGDMELGRMDVAPFMRVMEKMWKIFKQDAEGRGLYILPTTVQTINSDGTVKHTACISDEGVEIMQGGIPGIPASAPKEFIKASEETAKLFRGAGKKSNVPQTPAKKETSKKNEEVDFGEAFTKNLRGASLPAKRKGKKQEGKKDDNMDFGKGFGEKLRGAFI